MSRMSILKSLIDQYIRMPEGIIPILGTLGIVLFFGSLLWMLILKLIHRRLSKRSKMTLFSSMEISTLCELATALIGTGYLITLSYESVIENIMGDVFVIIVMTVLPILIFKLKHKIIKVILFVIELGFLLDSWIQTIMIVGSTLFMLIVG